MITDQCLYFSLILATSIVTRTFGIFEYDRPEELNAYLENTTRTYPNVTSLIDLGLTFENRTIYCLKISKGNESVGRIITEFGAHAREWAAHTAATHVIHELLHNKKYDELITKITWFIVPLLNPDGFWYSKIEDRDWRKNRRLNLENEKCPGVDVNRNFPVKWLKRETICDEDYGGTRPSSESETMAIERLFELIPGSKVDVYISIHTDAQCIVLPYAYTNNPPPSYKSLYKVAKKMKSAMESVAYPEYKIIQASQMYEVSGTVFDWAYDHKGVPLVFTLELPFSSERHERFRVDRSEMVVIAKQCIAALEICALEIMNRHQPTVRPTTHPAEMNQHTIKPRTNSGNTNIISFGKEMIEPVKLGIKADPPSLIFVYKMWERLRMRTMPIRNLWPTTSTKFILEDIRARHDILLGVPDDIIVKMIDVLKSLKAGVELEAALAKHEQENIVIQEGTDKDSQKKTLLENRLSEEKGPKEEGKLEENGGNKKESDGRKEKPYSFMDKRLTDEDTDFDLNDDLPLDELDGNSDDDFWR